jgi:hypothetical protein
MKKGKPTMSYFSFRASQNVEDQEDDYGWRSTEDELADALQRVLNMVVAGDLIFHTETPQEADTVISEMRRALERYANE